VLGVGDAHELREEAAPALDGRSEAIGGHEGDLAAVTAASTPAGITAAAGDLEGDADELARLQRCDRVADVDHLADALVA
jgi:hypothetical protein